MELSIGNAIIGIAFEDLVRFSHHGLDREYVFLKRGHARLDVVLSPLKSEEYGTKIPCHLEDLHSPLHQLLRYPHHFTELHHQIRERLKHLTRRGFSRAFIRSREGNPVSMGCLFPNESLGLIVVLLGKGCDLRVTSSSEEGNPVPAICMFLSGSWGSGMVPKETEWEFLEPFVGLRVVLPWFPWVSLWTRAFSSFEGVTLKPQGPVTWGSVRGGRVANDWVQYEVVVMRGQQQQLRTHVEIKSLLDAVGIDAVGIDAAQVYVSDEVQRIENKAKTVIFEWQGSVRGGRVANDWVQYEVVVLRGQQQQLRTHVEIKSLLDAVGIDAAQVYVNTALMKLVLLMNFKKILSSYYCWIYKWYQSFVKQAQQGESELVEKL
nr:hypothetical protein [Tanacetum cinerariifolium]